MQKRLIRGMAIIMILTPWIYIPGIYKEILIMVFGFVLLFTTITLKKK